VASASGNVDYGTTRTFLFIFYHFSHHFIVIRLALGSLQRNYLCLHLVQIFVYVATWEFMASISAL
jgi:hypothetical protein